MERSMAPPIVASTGVSHIALRVTDVDRAVDWYRAVLGYEVLWNGHAPTPDRTRSAMGLVAGGSLALEFLETPAGKPWTVESLGVAGISLTVPDIDAAVAAFNASRHGQAAQVYVAEDWRVAFLFDPDRNVVELVEQPAGAASIAAFAPTLRARRDAAQGSQVR
jgi:catechol 2,3-dioxygenase-like lactoylglutathione lyase family enzyme